MGLVQKMIRLIYARVAELVDALDLGSSSGDRVGVQVSPLAPFYPGIVLGLAEGAG